MGKNGKPLGPLGFSVGPKLLKGIKDKSKLLKKGPLGGEQAEPVEKAAANEKK